MAERSEPGRPIRSGSTGPPAPIWRTWLIWVAALTVPILLIRLLSDAPSDRNEIPYSVFAEQLERGNLARVEITPNEPQLFGAFSRPVDLDSVTVTEFRVVLPYQNADDLVARMEAQHIPISARSPGPSWTSIVLPMLPWLLLIGFWIFLLRRMQSGGQQALAFGRSGAKLLTPDVPKLTFADVAGADEAKQELQELIDFLRDPDRFRRLGGRLPKGVLLVGPPGTGKTLLARAVAGEAGCAFLSISGSDFVEMFVGVGASRVRDLFRQGKAYAPAIIFIDELDAVGRQRGAGLGGGHDEREQTLNQLLVELDGFEPKEGVILLSATNRPDVLDPALLRPGRFDRRIVVDLPDLKAREQILEVHARKIVLGEDVDLASIARGTPGMSGADLANMANEAALFAARRHREYVGQREFEDAKDKVMLGVERRSLVLTPEERRLAAYHEAGHTLVNLLIPGLDPVYKVTIVPRDRAMGATFSLPEVDRRSYTRAFLMGRLAVAYGGRIAEELTFGPEDVTTGAAQDFQQATDMARRMVTQFGMSDVLGPVAVGGSTEEVFLGRELVHGRDVSNRTADMIDQEVRRLVTAAYTRARELIGSHRNALDALAAALLERETLDADDVRRIFTETVDAPPTDAVVTETAV